MPTPQETRKKRAGSTRTPRPKAPPVETRSPSAGNASKKRQIEPLTVTSPSLLDEFAHEVEPETTAGSRGLDTLRNAFSNSASRSQKNSPASASGPSSLPANRPAPQQPSPLPPDNVVLESVDKLIKMLSGNSGGLFAEKEQVQEQPVPAPKRATPAKQKQQPSLILNPGKEQAGIQSRILKASRQTLLNDGLLRAAAAGDVASVRRLLAHRANPNASDLNKRSALHWAADAGNKEIIQLLLAHDADVKAQDNFGESPLHWAAVKGHLDAVTVLLQKGAPVDCADEYGNTPLHFAAGAGRYSVCEALLAGHADLHATNMADKTPFDLAHNEAVLTLLLSWMQRQQASKSFLPQFFNDAWRGSASGAAPIFTAMQGLQPAGSDQEPSSPTSAARAVVAFPLTGASEQLVGAVYAGDVERVIALVEEGANVNTREEITGNTLLHIAAYEGHTELVAFLLRCGLPPNQTCKVGKTALHHAVARGFGGIARLLVAAGADVNKLDKLGVSPLDMAKSVSSASSSVQDMLGELSASQGDTSLDLSARFDAVADEVRSSGSVDRDQAQRAGGEASSRASPSQPPPQQQQQLERRGSLQKSEQLQQQQARQPSPSSQSKKSRPQTPEQDPQHPQHRPQQPTPMTLFPELIAQASSAYPSHSPVLFRVPSHGRDGASPVPLGTVHLDASTAGVEHVATLQGQAMITPPHAWLGSHPFVETGEGAVMNASFASEDDDGASSQRDSGAQALGSLSPSDLNAASVSAGGMKASSKPVPVTSAARATTSAVSTVQAVPIAPYSLPSQPGKPPGVDASSKAPGQVASREPPLDLSPEAAVVGRFEFLASEAAEFIERDLEKQPSGAIGSSGLAGSLPRASSKGALAFPLPDGPGASSSTSTSVAEGGIKLPALSGSAASPAVGGLSALFAAEASSKGLKAVLSHQTSEQAVVARVDVVGAAQAREVSGHAATSSAATAASRVDASVGGLGAFPALETAAEIDEGGLLAAPATGKPVPGEDPVRPSGPVTAASGVAAAPLPAGAQVSVSLDKDENVLPTMASAGEIDPTAMSTLPYPPEEARPQLALPAREDGHSSQPSLSSVPSFHLERVDGLSAPSSTRTGHVDKAHMPGPALATLSAADLAAMVARSVSRTVPSHMATSPPASSAVVTGAPGVGVATTVLRVPPVSSAVKVTAATPHESAGLAAVVAVPPPPMVTTSSQPAGGAELVDMASVNLAKLMAAATAATTTTTTTARVMTASTVAAAEQAEVSIPAGVSNEAEASGDGSLGTDDGNNRKGFYLPLPPASSILRSASSSASEKAAVSSILRSASSSASEKAAVSSILRSASSSASEKAAVAAAAAVAGIAGLVMGSEAAKDGTSRGASVTVDGTKGSTGNDSGSEGVYPALIPVRVDGGGDSPGADASVVETFVLPAPPASALSPVLHDGTVGAFVFAGAAEEADFEEAVVVSRRGKDKGQGKSEETAGVASLPQTVAAAQLPSADPANNPAPNQPTATTPSAANKAVQRLVLFTDDATAGHDSDVENDEEKFFSLGGWKLPSGKTSDGSPLMHMHSTAADDDVDLSASLGDSTGVGDVLLPAWSGPSSPPRDENGVPLVTRNPGKLRTSRKSPVRESAENASEMVQAAKEGKVGYLRDLIDAGGNVDRRSKNGESLLHVAAMYGQVDVAGLLLRRGASIEATDKRGRTPLHIASSCGHRDVATILMRSGANIEALDNNGETPIMLSSTKSIRRLMEGPSPVTSPAMSPLTSPVTSPPESPAAARTASMRSRLSPDMFKKFTATETPAEMLPPVRSKPRKPFKESYGSTPVSNDTDLLLAADNNDVAMLEQLIAGGASVDFTDMDKRTALHHAAHRGHVEAAKVLLKHGWGVNASNKLGRTPLHEAARHGQLAMMNLLLLWRADVDHLDTSGATPLDVAGTKEAQNLLIDRMYQQMMAVSPGFLKVMSRLSNTTDLGTSLSSKMDKSPSFMKPSVFSSEAERGADLASLPEDAVANTSGRTWDINSLLGKASGEDAASRYGDIEGVGSRDADTQGKGGGDWAAASARGTRGDSGQGKDKGPMSPAEGSRSPAIGKFQSITAKVTAAMAEPALFMQSLSSAPVVQHARRKVQFAGTAEEVAAQGGISSDGGGGIALPAPAFDDAGHDDLALRLPGSSSRVDDDGVKAEPVTMPGLGAAEIAQLLPGSSSGGQPGTVSVSSMADVAQKVPGKKGREGVTAMSKQGASEASKEDQPLSQPTPPQQPRGGFLQRTISAAKELLKGSESVASSSKTDAPKSSKKTRAPSPSVPTPLPAAATGTPAGAPASSALPGTDASVASLPAGADGAASSAVGSLSGSTAAVGTPNNASDKTSGATGSLPPTQRKGEVVDGTMAVETAAVASMSAPLSASALHERANAGTAAPAGASSQKLSSPTLTWAASLRGKPDSPASAKKSGLSPGALSPRGGPCAKGDSPQDKTGAEGAGQRGSKQAGVMPGLGGGSAADTATSTSRSKSKKGLGVATADRADAAVEPRVGGKATEDVGQKATGRKSGTVTSFGAQGNGGKEGGSSEVVDGQERLNLELLRAAKVGSLERVEALLDSGANVDYADKYGRTSLHKSAARGYQPVVNVLVAAGASLTARDKNGRTPADVASGPDIANLLHVAQRLKSSTGKAAAAPGSLRALDRARMAASSDAVQSGSARSSIAASEASTMSFGASSFATSSGEPGEEAVNAKLLKACVKGDLVAVRLMLDAGADACFVDKRGYTPLHYAVAAGQDHIASLLLQHGADVGAQDKSGATPMDMASGNSDIRDLLEQRSYLKNLKQKQPRAERTPQPLPGRAASPGGTPYSGTLNEDLMRAATKGDAKSVRSLIEQGANPAFSDERGETPLHRAAARGREEVVRALVSLGAPLDARSWSGETPLHFAAVAGRGAVATLLLELGASAFVNDKDGSSVTDVCCNEATRVAITKYIAEHGLVEKKASSSGALRAVDLFPGTPLSGDDDVDSLMSTPQSVPSPATWLSTVSHQSARSRSSSEGFGSPYASSAAVSPVKLNIETSMAAQLAAACAQGDVRAVEELLAQRADPAHRDEESGLYPLHVAAEHGHAVVVRALLEKSVLPLNVNQVDEWGRTAVHAAALHGHAKVVKILALEGKANMGIKDKGGKAPQDLALDDDLRQLIIDLALANSAFPDPIPYQPASAAPTTKSPPDERPQSVSVPADASRAALLGRTASMAAAKAAKASLVAQLCEACANGDVKLVKELLASGADPTIRDKKTGLAPLHFAAEGGHVEVVRVLLAHVTPRVDVNQTDDFGRTALHAASLLGHAEVATVLVRERKARVEIRDLGQKTPLDLAISDEMAQLLKDLAASSAAIPKARQSGAAAAAAAAADLSRAQPAAKQAMTAQSVTAQPIVAEVLSVGSIGAAEAVHVGKTAPRFATTADKASMATQLRQACAIGDARAVEQLLVAGAEPSGRDDSSTLVPLLLAAEGGHAGVVKSLLQKSVVPVDVNVADESGRTALHVAASRGHAEVVRLLVVEGKALPGIKDKDGKTPLDLAMSNEVRQLLKDLAAASAAIPETTAAASATARGSSQAAGTSPATVTAKVAGQQAVTVVAVPVPDASQAVHLPKTGPRLEDSAGRASRTSQLCRACAIGDATAVEQLLMAGAEPSSRDDSSMLVPLLVAAEGGHAVVVKSLLQKSVVPVDVNVVDESGRTALHVAASRGHAEVVRLLVVEGKALPGIKDKSGKTPLDLATSNKVRQLLQDLAPASAATPDTSAAATLTPASRQHTATVATTASAKSEVAQVVSLPLSASSSHAVHVGKTAPHSPIKVAKASLAAQLCQACSVGQVAAAEELLALRADPTLRDDASGTVPLLVAAEGGHAGVVKSLLQKSVVPVDVNVADESGRTALHVAASRGHAEVVRLLVLEGKALVDARDKDGKTPLDLAATDEVRQLLKELASATAAIPEKPLLSIPTAASPTADSGNWLHPEVVSPGSKARAMARMASRGTDTSASNAVPTSNDLAGAPESAVERMRLAEGSRSSPADEDARRASSLAGPLREACTKGDVAAVEKLLASGADPTRKAEGDGGSSGDGGGITPFLVAVEKGHAKVVQLLLQKSVVRVDVRAVDKRGRVALHVAAARGHAEVVRLLVLEGKALVDVRDKDGKTPLDLAATAEVRKLLKELASATAAIREKAPTPSSSQPLVAVSVPPGSAHSATPVPAGATMTVMTARTAAPATMQATVISPKTATAAVSSHTGAAADKAQEAAPVGSHTSLPSAAASPGPKPNLEASLGAQLYHACAAGDVKVVTELLVAGADPAHRDEDSGLTALHVAVEKGHAGVVRALLQKSILPVNVNMADESGRTAVHVAAVRGHAKLVEILMLEGKALLGVRDKDGKLPRDLAATDEVRKLLRELAMADAMLPETALARTSSRMVQMPKPAAAAAAATAATAALAGSASNAVAGATTAADRLASMTPPATSSTQKAQGTGAAHVVPLMTPAEASQESVVAHGKAPEGSKLMTRSEEALAAAQRAKEIYEKRNSLDGKDKRVGRPMLGIKTQAGGGDSTLSTGDLATSPTAQSLVSPGAWGTARSGGSASLSPSGSIGPGSPSLSSAAVSPVKFDLEASMARQLCEACAEGDVGMVQELLASRANPMYRDEGGSGEVLVALHVAAEHGHAGVVRALLEKSILPVNVNAVDESGRTAVHVAALRGHADVVKLLVLEGKALVDVKDKDGKTPLDVAATDQVRQLLKELASATAAIPERAIPRPIPSPSQPKVATAVPPGRGPTSGASTSFNATLPATKESGAAPLAKPPGVAVPVVPAASPRGLKSPTQRAPSPLTRKPPPAVSLPVAPLPAIALLTSPVRTSSDPAPAGVNPAALSLADRQRSLSRLTIHRRSLSLDLGDGEANEAAAVAKAREMDQGARDAALLDACRAADHSLVRMFLKAGASPVCRDQSGATPLHLAAEQGDSRSVISLIATGKPDLVSLVAENGRSPLHLAAMYGHVPVITQLLRAGSSVSTLDNEGRTPIDLAATPEIAAMMQTTAAEVPLSPIVTSVPVATPTSAYPTTPRASPFASPRKSLEDRLSEACTSGTGDEIRALVQEGADPAKAPENAALLKAAQAGNVAAITTLLALGCPLDGRGRMGQSALHCSAIAGHEEATEVLLDAGAEVDAVDKNGETPLHMAALGGHMHVAQLLLRRGAKFSVRDKDGMLPYDFASNDEMRGVFGGLLSPHAPSATTPRAEPFGPATPQPKEKTVTVHFESPGSKRTPVDLRKLYREAIEMAGAGDLAELKRILRDLRNPKLDHVKDAHGKTLLHAAASAGHNHVVEWLLEKGVWIDIIDKYGETALHRASQKGKLDTVKRLLDKGADVSVKKHDGRTPLDLAHTREMKNILRHHFIRSLPPGVPADGSAEALPPVRSFPARISYESLLTLTADFSASNLVASSRVMDTYRVRIPEGFGHPSGTATPATPSAGATPTVFSGYGGVDVAVRRVVTHRLKPHAAYLVAAQVYQSLRHPGIVRGLAHCPEPGRQILVTEFMGNGSLANRLECRGGTPPLPWHIRLAIAVQVAKGLHYLHTARPGEPITHRSLRSSKILLDANLIAKISDISTEGLLPRSFTTMEEAVMTDGRPIDGANPSSSGGGGGAKSVGTPSSSYSSLNLTGVLQDFHAAPAGSYAAVPLGSVPGSVQNSFVGRSASGSTGSLHGAGSSIIVRTSSGVGGAGSLPNDTKSPDEHIEADVRAFGDVLLELLTGRLMYPGLREEIKVMWRRKRLQDISDPIVNWPQHFAARLARLGLECSSTSSKARTDLPGYILPKLVDLCREGATSHHLVRFDKEHIPDTVFCPMMHVMMSEPFTAEDGYTYERKAIREWMKGNDTSPITGLPLNDRYLIANNGLRMVLWKISRT
eukprot:jgi/Mesvir1/20563/Mv06235-RA.5